MYRRSSSTCHGRPTYCLPKHIPAIPITVDEKGRIHLGSILKLPQGAEIELCGDGYNDSTTKVSWGGALFYVFRDDIQLAQTAAPA